jgi:AraC-like DNA-binding protein
MPQSASRRSFFLLTPPYLELIPVTGPLPVTDAGAAIPGSALVWRLAVDASERALRFARNRPPGSALIAILPTALEVGSRPDLLRIVERTHPQAILPFHHPPDLEDLTSLIRRPPSDLAIEFTDYLVWRGIRLDRETRRLVRRTVELSAELRTISGLARAVYLSRRALGRRFMSRGLPVPSHWLHFARILRAALQLQNSQDSLVTVACDLGYSDGFALSNQMVRLTGVRPSTARVCLGWEWLVESWLVREASQGSLVLPPWRTQEASEVQSTDPLVRRSWTPSSSHPSWRRSSSLATEVTEEIRAPVDGGSGT